MTTMCRVVSNATLVPAIHMIIALFFLYLGRLQKQLVEVHQVWLDGQQNAAVNSVAPLKPLSIHYAIHSVIHKEDFISGLTRELWLTAPEENVRQK